MSNLATLDRSQLEQLFLIQQEIKLRARRSQFKTQFSDSGPNRRELYPKHLQFFDAGLDYKLRLFMAANRVGKTHAAAYEITLHLTGLYPDWWTGRRFDRPSQWWVCGKDSKTVLEILQNTLLGPVGDFGTGMIPYDTIDHETLKEARKADTGIGMFRVRHRTGGHSSVTFKSYDAGRTSFEGTARCIWLDEEPPLAVFTECLLRTATDDNILMMTFTPLKGISETVVNFLEGSQFHEGPIGVGKHVTMASWDDVPHLSARDKEILLASIPPFQRDARTRGIPQLGAGAIYPVPESEICVDTFELPKHWPRFYAMDVGWSRTAALWFAIDPSTKIKYIYHEYYRGEAEPSIHASSIKIPGAWIHGVIDTASRGRSQIDGQNLLQMYRDLGLTLHDADKAVETGLYTTWEQLSTGRLKVFKNLKNFLSEYRMYRRDESGKVVKQNDHLMDCLRYGVMSQDAYAKTEVAQRPRAGGGLPGAGNIV